MKICCSDFEMQRRLNRDAVGTFGLDEGWKEYKSLDFDENELSACAGKRKEQLQA